MVLLWLLLFLCFVFWYVGDGGITMVAGCVSITPVVESSTLSVEELARVRWRVWVVSVTPAGLCGVYDVGVRGQVHVQDFS